MESTLALAPPSATPPAESFPEHCGGLSGNSLSHSARRERLALIQSRFTRQPLYFAQMKMNVYNEGNVTIGAVWAGRQLQQRLINNCFHFAATHFQCETSHLAKSISWSIFN